MGLHRAELYNSNHWRVMNIDNEMSKNKIKKIIYKQNSKSPFSSRMLPILTFNGETQVNSHDLHKI